MQVHIHINKEDELGGYTNVCLSETENRNTALAAIDDAEATEIVLNNTLEFIPLGELTDFLSLVIKKLRHNGTLILTGVDAYTAAKDFTSYKIGIEDFNILLHGNQRDSTNIKTATLTLHGMVKFLQEDFGLKVMRKTLEDYNYVIEAKRP